MSVGSTNPPRHLQLGPAAPSGPTSAQGETAGSVTAAQQAVVLAEAWVREAERKQQLAMELLTNARSVLEKRRQELLLVEQHARAAEKAKLEAEARARAAAIAADPQLAIDDAHKRLAVLEARRARAPPVCVATASSSAATR